MFGSWTFSTPKRLDSFNNPPPNDDYDSYELVDKEHLGVQWRIWQLKTLGAKPATSAKSNGCVCTKCKARNEYAEPNRPEGKYLCFECR